MTWILANTKPCPKYSSVSCPVSGSLNQDLKSQRDVIEVNIQTPLRGKCTVHVSTHLLLIWLCVFLNSLELQTTTKRNTVLFESPAKADLQVQESDREEPGLHAHDMQVNPYAVATLSFLSRTLFRIGLNFEPSSAKIIFSAISRLVSILYLDLRNI